MKPTLRKVPQRNQATLKQVKNSQTSINIPPWAPVALLIFTAVLYSGAITNAINDLDDNAYITNNRYLRDFSFHGVKEIFTTFYASNYHPLTTLVWLFEFHWFGLNPAAYHLSNVLLHLLNTWLVLRVTEELSSRKLTAIIVATLFAIHPMHVESVAWISELKDVLYAAFYLLSVWVYLRYLKNGYKRADYLSVLLLFIASLLSKPSAVTLPVLLIAIDFYKGRRAGIKALAEKIPFFVLSVVFGIINILAQKTAGPVDILLQSKGVINSLFLVASAISSYVLKVIAPVGLCAMNYFPHPSNGLLPAMYYLSLPLLAVFTWLIARKSSHRKELLFGAAFFLVTISVMLQIVNVGLALTAERYTYIPYIGLFYIIGQYSADVIEKKPGLTKTVLGICAVFVVLFSLQTFSRIKVWKDTNSMYTDIIEKNTGNPDVSFIYMRRAFYKMQQHDLRGALEDYTSSIDMAPGYLFKYSAYGGRANVYEELGDAASAFKDYDMSIKLNPGNAAAYNSRGWLLYRTGQKQLAMRDFNKAIALKKDFAEAYNNRGWAYYQAGNNQLAMEDFTRATSADPMLPMPYYNRAEIKTLAGNLQGAIDEFSSLLQNDPRNCTAFYNRGVARLKINDKAGACADWNQARSLGNEAAGEMLKQYCR